MNKTLYGDMREYNKKVFPAQIITSMLGAAAAIFLFVNPSKATFLLSLIVLAIFYLWVGITYPFLFKKLLNRNKVMVVVVVVNLILGIVVLINMLILRNSNTAITLQDNLLKVYISIGLTFWGVLVHPVEGMIFRDIKSAAYLGVYTCPTFPYAIGVLSAINYNPIAMFVLIVISCMAIATGISAGLLGMKKEHIYEDIVLIPIGLYGLLSILI